MAVKSVKEDIDEYIQAFAQHEETFNELRSTEALESQEKLIPFSKSCLYVGQALKLAAYGQYFKDYQKDIALCSSFFHPTDL